MKNMAEKREANHDEIKCERKQNEQEKDSSHASQVLENLWRIYTEKKLCDVTLIVENEEVRAHRLVLAANSVYFYTMFTSGLSESSAQKIVLKEVEFKALRLLVEYCYTSLIHLDESNVECLLKAAHLLQFNDVVSMCCVFMKSQLHPTNCLGVSSLAELHGCTSLRDSAMSYARKHFVKVATTEEFFIAPFAQISDLLLNDSLNVSSEKDVFDIAMTWIKHDLENRKGFLPQILDCVRLPLLSPKVLVDCIEKDELVSANRLCLNQVSEAKSYHLLPERQEELGSAKKKPRLQDVGVHLYVVGGEIRSYVFNTLDCYSFYTDTWTSLSCLHKPRDGVGVATYNGRIFAAGGCDGDSALNSVECYNPNMDTWNFVNPMSLNRHAFSLVQMRGWLYAIGGSDFCHTEFDSVERYDPVRDSWSTTTPMIAKREGLETVTLNGSLYAMGGDNGIAILNTMEHYDSRVGFWSNCTPMAYRRRYFGAAVLRNQIVVLGGSDSDEDHNSVECYDPRMNRWLALPPLLVRRESPGAAVVGDRFFAIGGAFMNVETNSIDVYSMVDNKWMEFTPMPRAMEGMGLAVL